jgi:hypothetical protein
VLRELPERVAKTADQRLDLLRATNLTSIVVPDERDEAIRDLTRAARHRVRLQMQAMMLVVNLIISIPISPSAAKSPDWLIL